jgi:hypothetical protein
MLACHRIGTQASIVDIEVVWHPVLEVMESLSVTLIRMICEHIEN